MAEEAKAESEVVVRVGDKEIPVNEEVLEVLQEYLKTAMPLEQLARKLGLRNWAEAYEFLKAVPAWAMWVPPAFWRIQAKKPP